MRPAAESAARRARACEEAVAEDVQKALLGAPEAADGPEGAPVRALAGADGLPVRGQGGHLCTGTRSRSWRHAAAATTTGGQFFAQAPRSGGRARADRKRRTTADLVPPAETNSSRTERLADGRAPELLRRLEHLRGVGDGDAVELGGDRREQIHHAEETEHLVTEVGGRKHQRRHCIVTSCDKGSTNCVQKGSLRR